MRKHRHFAVVIAALLGTGFVAQRFDTPTASAGTNPADQHPNSTDSASRSGQSRLEVRTLSVAPGSSATGDRLLALTTAMVALPPTAPPPPPPPRPATAASSAPAAGVWAELRQCESAGNYADNTGNGYYGAYQFSLATWRSLGLSGLPSDAPAAEQDQAAQELQAVRGWGQWPACASRLGLT